MPIISHTMRHPPFETHHAIEAFCVNSVALHRGNSIVLAGRNSRRRLNSRGRDNAPLMNRLRDLRAELIRPEPGEPARSVSIVEPLSNFDQCIGKSPFLKRRVRSFAIE